MTQLEQATSVEAQIDTTNDVEELSSKGDVETLDLHLRILKDTQIRRKIAQAISLVRSGKTIKVSGFGQSASKVLQLCMIVSDRVGDLHRVNQVLVDDRYGSGLQIELSLDKLDTSHVGYQKPKPRGFY